MRARAYLLVALGALAACGRLGFDDVAGGSAWQPFGTGVAQSERLVWGSASGGGVSNNLGAVTRLLGLVFVDGNPVVGYAAYDPDMTVFARGLQGDAWVDRVTPRESPAGAPQVVAFDAEGRPIVAWVNTEARPIERWNGTQWDVLPGLGSGALIALAADTGGALLAAVRPSTSSLIIRRFDGVAWTDLGASLTSSTSLLAFSLHGAQQPVACWVEAGAVRVEQWDGTTWNELSGAAPQGSFLGCTLDDVERPIILWATTAGSLYANRWRETGWEELYPGSASGQGIGQITSGRTVLDMNVAVHGEDVIASWTENQGGQRTSFVRTRVGGATSQPTQLAGTGSSLAAPEVAFDPSGRPCLASFRGTGRVVDVQCVEDSALVEYPPVREALPGISATPGDAVEPELAAGADGRLELAWEEEVADGSYVYTRQLVGDAWTTRTPDDASGLGIAGNAWARAPTIAVGNSTWLFWQHDIYCLMAKRWDGTAWIEIVPGSATEDATACGLLVDGSLDVSRPHVVVDAADQPWASWSDDGYSFNAYAGTLTGGAWTRLGPQLYEQGLAPGQSRESRVALHASAGLFITYRGSGSGDPSQQNIFVQHWNGTAWEGLAGSDVSPGISGGAPTLRSRIAVDAEGRPWVTWAGRSTGRWQVYVTMFDGTAWVDVGGAASGEGLSASPERAIDPTIVFDASDHPIVLWTDHASGSWEIYAKRWNGEEWQALAGSASGGGISNSSAPSAAPTAVMRGDQLCVVWSEPDRRDWELRGRCLGLGGL